MALLLRHVAHVEFTLFNMVEWNMSCDEMLALDAASFRTHQAHSPIGAKVIDGNYHIIALNRGDTPEWFANESTKQFTKTLPRSTCTAHAGNREVCSLLNARKKLRRRE